MATIVKTCLKCAIKSPTLVLYGFSVVSGIWITSPLLILGFRWLPWIWAGYSMYKSIPPVIITAGISGVKVIKEYVEKC